MERMVIAIKNNQVLNIQRGRRKAKKTGARSKGIDRTFCLTNQDIIKCMIRLRIDGNTIRCELN
jgi:hypothetical protein